METLVFTEGASPQGASRKPRNSWIILSIVVSLIILVLVLLSLLIAFLFHYNQSPKKCWIHGSSPATSQAAIIWKWEQKCSGSGLIASDSSVEILESDMYFVYMYVARMEDITTENYFTVQLIQFSDSNRTITHLSGVNDTRAFITLGRPYFLKKGITLHLAINAGLAHINSNRTYWGLFRI